MERDLLKKATVDSTGYCNAFRKLSARGDVAKRFPRPCVQFKRDRIEISLTVDG